MDEIGASPQQLFIPYPEGLVVACVGGGGLLCGIYNGLSRASLHHVPVVATETEVE